MRMAGLIQFGLFLIIYTQVQGSLRIPDVNTSYISLEWDMSQDTTPDNYTVEYFKISDSSNVMKGDQDLTLCEDSTTTSCADLINLDSGETYNITIIELGTDSNSTDLYTREVTTKVDPPTNLTPNIINNTNVQLSWTAPTGIVKHYRVYVDPRPEGQADPPYNDVNETQTDITVLPGRLYNATVASVDNANREENSTTATFSTAPLPVDADTIEINIDNQAAIDVTWRQPDGSDVQSYLVKIMSPSEARFSNQQSEDVVSESKVTVSGVPSGALVKVEIRAKSHEKTSGATLAERRTKPTAVDPDTIQCDITNKTHVTCKWSKPNTQADTYKAKATVKETVQEESVSFTETEPGMVVPAQPGAKVTVEVVVASGNENSTLSSNDYKRKPLAVDASTVNLQRNEDSTMLQWSKPADSIVDSYTVTISEGQMDATLGSNSVTNTEVVVNSIKPGQKLTFQFVTVSNGVNGNATSKEFHLEPLAVDASTVILQRNEDSTMLQWSKPADSIVDSYTVTISEGQMDATLGSNSVTNTEVVVNAIKPGQKLTFRIVTVSNGVNGTATSKEFHLAPAPVTAITASEVTDTTADVTWTAALGVASSYSFNMTPWNDNEDVQKNGDTGRSLKNLNPGTKYTVQVTTISGEKKSEPANYTFTTKPGGVTLTLTKINNTRIRLEWTEVSSTSDVEYEITNCVAPTSCPTHVLTHLSGGWKPGAAVSYRALFSDPNSEPTVDTVSTTSYEMTVVQGERYNFTVRAILGNHYGEKGTKLITMTPRDPGPMSVTDVQPRSVKIAWTPVASESFAHGYLLSVSSVENATSPAREIFVDGQNNSSHVLDGLVPGAHYDVHLWTVTKLNSDYLKSEAKQDKSVTAKPILTAEFRDASPEGKNNGLTIKFTENEYYFNKIHMNLTSVGLYSNQNNKSSEFTFLGLKNGTAYEVEVWLSSKILGTSLEIQSERKYYTFATAPGEVKNLTLTTPSQNMIRLAWQKVKEGSRVRIECLWDDSLDVVLNSETSHKVVEGLEPFVSYEFRLSVIRHNKTSKATRGKVRTREAPPSAVADLKATNVNSDQYTQAWLEWRKPSSPRGEITKYIVRYVGVSTTHPDTSAQHIDEIEFEASKFDGQTNLIEKITALKGGRRYVITMWAENGAGRGDARSTSVTTLSGTPFITESTYQPSSDGSKVTTNEISIRLRNVFDDTNGYITGYSVIVYEDVDRRVSLDKVSMYKLVQAGSGPWPAYFATRECPVFSANSVCDKPATVQSRRKRSTDQEVVFAIGAQDCTHAKEDEVCNGPLKEGTGYRVVLRAHSPTGHTDSNPSDVFRTESPGSTGVIIGVVIALVVILIVAVLGAVWLYIKYRRTGPPLKKGPREPPPSRPVRVHEFPNHYRFMSADADFRFCEEYENLKSVGREQSIEEATKDYNCGKNRFANIQPYDWSRVKLSMMDDVPGSDYINANYMPGHNSPREFVVCQGPLVATIDDFWRMVWEQRCVAIVMLTQLIDNGREKCSKYWPSDTNPIRYGDVLVTIANETCYESFSIMELRLQKDDQTRAVKHFFYKAWPDFGVPQDTSSLLKFISFIRKKIGKTQPICVHCSAGVGRSGTYIALDKLIQDMESGSDRVDIYGTVHAMRRHRCLMVQTEQQYKFIHRAIRDIVEGAVRIDSVQPICGNTNPAFNAYYDCGVEDGKWSLQRVPPTGYHLILEDEGVQLEMMA